MIRNRIAANVICFVSSAFNEMILKGKKFIAYKLPNQKY